MIRKFILEYDWWKAELVIDEEKAATALKESVEFWADWQRHLARCRGDYTLAFVQNVAPLLIDASQENGLGWLQEQYFKRREGYGFNFDNSEGVLLESCDEWEIDEDSITITEDNRP